MYEKDKKQRITLRLNEEQFAFIAGECDVLGITPSDYLRMLVNTSMYSAKMAKEKGFDFEGAKSVAKEILEEAKGRENDKADKHD